MFYCNDMIYYYTRRYCIYLTLYIIMLLSAGSARFNKIVTKLIYAHPSGQNNTYKTYKV